LLADSSRPVAVPAEEFGVSLPDTSPVPDAESFDVPEVLPAEPAPRRDGERLPVLDLLRGIAILGILPANIPIYGLFTAWGGSPAESGIVTWADRAATALTHVFIDGKMITLLSILFGVGLAIQAERARAANRPFVEYYLRRLALLFAIGLAHALLLWFGDILTSYAIVGVGALFLGMLGRRGLRWAIAACFTWAYGFVFAVVLLGWALGADEHKTTASGSPARAAESKEEEPGEAVGQAIEKYFSEANITRIYREGPYWEIVVNRLVCLAFTAVVFWLVMGWYLLGCFLVGISLLRRGLFHDVSRHRRLLYGFLAAGLLVGLPLEVLYAVAEARAPNSLLPTLYWCSGALLMALGYLALFALWGQSGRVEWLQRRFRAVGRMALTNYLLQSVICTTLFYSYGFALFGRFGRAELLLVVAAVWLCELIWSPIWMRYFRMGPVEWVWRSLAEGRRKPFLQAPLEAPSV
jgi:uncharacterized protein